MSNLNNDKSYLIALIEKVEIFKREKKIVPFIVTDAKEKGFVIKVCGLFGFIPYYYMAWEYKSFDYWKSAAPYLIGKKFYCNIHQINRNPLSITINAKIHKFNTVELVENQDVKGVVVYKADYGVFIDVGFHFDWEFGALVGLFHQENAEDLEEYKQIEVGKEIRTRFLGCTEKGEITLGDKFTHKEWFTGELDKFLGTIQKVKVLLNEYGKRDFYVFGRHKGHLPITKLVYPEHRAMVKKFIKNLNHNDVIECEITNVKKQKRIMILKLSSKTMGIIKGSNKEPD